MRLITLSILCAFLFTTSSYSGTTLPEATKTVNEPSNEEISLIQAGTVSHDKKDYADALAKYDKALEVNPTSVMAMYEKAYTLSVMTKYDEAISIALHASEYKSSMLGPLYMIIANCLDDKGESEDALGVYTQAIKQKPSEFILHYNKGLCYRRLKRYEEAEQCFLDAIQRNLNHPTSYLSLADINANVFNRPGRAIACYMRFLSLEQKTERSERIANFLFDYRGGSRRTEKDGEINVSLNMGDSTDEFGSVAISASLFAMLGKLDTAKSSPGASKMMNSFDMKVIGLKSSISMIADLANSDTASMDPKLNKPFHKSRYFFALAPFFAGIKAAKLESAFMHYIFQSTEAEQKSEYADRDDNLRTVRQYVMRYGKTKSDDE